MLGQGDSDCSRPLKSIPTRAGIAGWQNREFPLSCGPAAVRPSRSLEDAIIAFQNRTITESPSFCIRPLPGIIVTIKFPYTPRSSLNCEIHFCQVLAQKAIPAWKAARQNMQDGLPAPRTVMKLMLALGTVIAFLCLRAIRGGSESPSPSCSTFPFSAALLG